MSRSVKGSVQGSMVSIGHAIATAAGKVAASPATARGVASVETVSITEKVSAVLKAGVGEGVGAGLDAVLVRAADLPPKGALRLLDYALPRDIREELIGDLEEEYRTRMLVRYSRREARFRFWWEAVRAVAPVLRRVVLRCSLFATIAKAAGWLWGKFGS